MTNEDGRGVPGQGPQLLPRLYQEDDPSRPGVQVMRVIRAAHRDTEHDHVSQVRRIEGHLALHGRPGERAAPSAPLLQQVGEEARQVMALPAVQCAPAVNAHPVILEIDFEEVDVPVPVLVDRPMEDAAPGRRLTQNDGGRHTLILQLHARNPGRQAKQQNPRPGWSRSGDSRPITAAVEAATAARDPQAKAGSDLDVGSQPRGFNQQGGFRLRPVASCSVGRWSRPE